MNKIALASIAISMHLLFSESLFGQIQCFTLSNTITLDLTTTTYDLDIRGDGSTDFIFSFGGNPDPQPYYQFSVVPQTSDQVSVFTEPFAGDFVCNLADCQVVQTSGTFSGQGHILSQQTPGPGEGNFYPGETGYIGFTDNGSYGWLAITINSIYNLEVNFTVQTYGIATPGYMGDVLANKCSVLPVELIGFEVESRGKDLVLVWEVGQEINLEKYEVQESKDGIQFKGIGNVIPSDQTKYEFVIFPRFPVSYYRLKIVDLDGTSDYSDIQSIKSNNQAVELINSVVVDQLYFQGFTKQLYWIVNLQGQIISNIEPNTTRWNAQFLSGGIYFLKSKDRMIKFIKT